MLVCGDLVKVRVMPVQELLVDLHLERRGLAVLYLIGSMPHLTCFMA